MSDTHRILDLKLPRTGLIMGKSKSGKSLWIAWYSDPDTKALSIKRIKTELWMGDKRYLIK